MLIGGVEAGGTKFNCAIYDDKLGRVRHSIRIETTTPKETVDRIFNWFELATNKLGPIDAIGLGIFGPLDIDSKSDTFGSIGVTSKISWSNINIATQFFDKFKVPLGFNTDVNSAALGEIHYGDNKNIETLLYVTIGTGIGVSVIHKKNVLFKSSHMEIGHMLLPGQNDKSIGSCLYHKNCWEGFCSGRAIELSSGLKPSEIPRNSLIWEKVIQYTSVAIYNLILSFSPDKIIIAGGVKNMGYGGDSLFIRRLYDRVNFYNEQYSNQLLNRDMIQLPSLSDKSGIYGAFYMGKRAHAVSSVSKIQCIAS